MRDNKKDSGTMTTSLPSDRDPSDKRVQQVHDLIPPEWDKGPLSLAHELRTMLKSVVDAGTNIDSGGGDGIADLWPTVSGVEYHIAISRAKSHDI